MFKYLQKLHENGVKNGDALHIFTVLIHFQPDFK